MSNSFSFSFRVLSGRMAEMEGEIREGFLCPMCMQDLGTVSQLQQHFDEAHPNEDSDVIQQLKGRHIVAGLSRLWVQRVIWTPKTLLFDSLDTQKFMSEFADDNFS